MSDEHDERAYREPVTDYQSKTVMLRAERGDEIAVGGLGTVTVARRKQTYFGPCLVLSDGDSNWELTAPGPDTDLLLWEAVEDDDGFRKGYRRHSEVSAELAETKPYDLCACGEPIKNQEHQRLATLNIGEHA